MTLKEEVKNFLNTLDDDELNSWVKHRIELLREELEKKITVYVLVSVADHKTEYENKPIGVFTDKLEILKLICNTIDKNYELHEMAQYTFIDTNKGQFAIYELELKAKA